MNDINVAIAVLMLPFLFQAIAAGELSFDLEEQAGDNNRNDFSIEDSVFLSVVRVRTFILLKNIRVIVRAISLLVVIRRALQIHVCFLTVFSLLLLLPMFVERRKMRV